jgi:uncharacterized protein (DUF302 family)
MKKVFFSLIIGILLGFAAAGYLVWKNMPEQMMNVAKSKYEFEETVSRLEEASFENGWEVLHIYDLGDCLFEEGYGSFMNVTVLSICQSEYSYEILQEDENKKIAAIMPCRIGVYEDSEGDVFITRMNIGLFSKVFPGTVGEILALVAADDEKIIENIIVK